MNGVPDSNGASVKTHDQVKEYYAALQGTKDLKTSACCSIPPEKIRALLKEIHPAVLDTFYGCGSPLPEALDGCTVLDLGSGSGRDCFIASKLVGPKGQVIGLDMTAKQLDIARTHIDWHMQKFGYSTPNVRFVEGIIEDLGAAGIQDESVDVVVSNCVINLSPDKGSVLKEAFRVLKIGGELYFSDVFADRRLPAHLREDQEVLGECLGGALYLEDFRRMLLELGCRDFRIVSRTPITVDDAGIALKVGNAKFESLTVRAFKLPTLEDRCEDYGQKVAVYQGTIADCPHTFILDDHHVFETGKPMLVCSNSAAMVSQTRLGPHFRVMGDVATHFGLFPCAPAPSDGKAGGGCC